MSEEAHTALDDLREEVLSLEVESTDFRHRRKQLQPQASLFQRTAQKPRQMHILVIEHYPLAYLVTLFLTWLEDGPLHIMTPAIR